MDDNPGSPNMCEFRKAGLPIYFLIGGPGSGKATQAARLQAKQGLTIINVGKLLRNESCSGSCGGTKLKHSLDNGELAPQDVTMQLLKEALLKSMCPRKPILIIGFPRNVCQLQAFEKEVAPAKGTFYLDASDCTLKNRQKFRGRADDKPETIEKKLQIFRKQTRPMIEQLINTGKISRIDGEKPTDEVFAELSKALQSQTSCGQATPNTGCNDMENEPSPCDQPKRPSNTCGQPPKRSTCEQPPKRNTCDQPPKQSTCDQPPKQSTCVQPPKKSTCDQPPKQNTCNQAPKRNSCDQPNRDCGR